MMKGNVVFMMPMLFGHANRTIKMAKLLQNKGYEVYYAGTIQLIRFTILNNFKTFTLQSQPIHQPLFKPFTKKGFTQWRADLKINRLFKDFEMRKSELKILVDKLQPSVVFLDEFCFLDYTILLSIRPDIKIYLLQGKMGMYYSKFSPPSNSFCFPNAFTKYHWQFVLLQQKLNDKVRYLANYSVEFLIQQMTISEKLKNTFIFNKQKIFSPSFIGNQELLLYVQEFDFPNNEILPSQQYLTPGVDLERKEIIPEKLVEFISKARAKNEHRIVYCSLGTIADTHLEKNVKKSDFFKKCLQIANKYPNLYFIISNGEDLDISLDSQIGKENILMMSFVPQIYTLKHADLFISHGGLNSIFEAIYTETPLLIFPLNNEWDQNGNAARAVYHKMGINSRIDEHIHKIEEKIFTLLEDKSFKSAIIKMANNLKIKYTDEVLSKQLDNLILLN